ncbi:uncharacterized protein UMAG_10986 [Mycosarcoma maydis]|uniref:Copper transport protein n=1 Tax=Mycosarcoma maydis TaxID=5270 RepID=A0A0D1DT72_MYCMD|nr:uncharacterized protein UMAG_10986 [Ustilago maydis 521]KIS67504.1 hypothetical protein UMAG_10986 [Ustilago maydis 521]|eukprot:XP_011390974.1 hypothetical protein UMAG_10986 [Ustilago maydis 521]
MDMSSATSSSKMGMATGSSDMQGWKPYLHTSLFSPFSNDASSGEAFLFPTFRIYSRTTFLVACAFIFTTALLERWLSFVLDHKLALRPTSVSHPTKARARRKGLVGSSDCSVYIHLPAQADHIETDHMHRSKIRLVLRTAVYFSATLLRYVLMIIGMGMDWMMLLSVVSGLALGHVLTDVYTVSWSTARSSVTSAERAEQVELLQHNQQDQTERYDVEVEEDDCKDDLIQSGASAQRSSSRQATPSANTPYY